MLALPEVGRCQNLVDAKFRIDRQPIDHLLLAADQNVGCELLKRLRARQGPNDALVNDARPTKHIVKAFVIFIGAFRDVSLVFVITDQKHASLQREPGIKFAASRGLAAREGIDLIKQLLVRAAKRCRLHMIASLGRRFDARRIHDCNHQRDRVFRARHNGQRFEIVARAGPRNIRARQQGLKNFNILFELRLCIGNRHAHAACFESKGAFANAQHQAPATQGLGLYGLSRQNAHVVQRQLDDGGDQFDVRCVRGDLHCHLQR